MQNIVPQLLSRNSSASPERTLDEMSRLYYLSRSLHVVAELGIADTLADKVVDVGTLATIHALDISMLERLLVFLSAYGVFERSKGGFCNTDLSAPLRGDHPASVKDNFRRIGSFWWSAVGDIEHTVRTGESAFTHLHGKPFFEYLGENPDIQSRFDTAMSSISNADNAAIASALDFSQFKHIVDVGGGKGGLLVEILKKAPTAKGVLFEQPQVISKLESDSGFNQNKQMELVSGDFFQAIAPGGDCYVIKGVLHDFNNDQCITILSNCRRAMHPDARILIANQDLPTPVDGPHPNLTMDIQMMTLLNGQERNFETWERLLSQSGLVSIQSLKTDSGFTVIESKSATQ